MFNDQIGKINFQFTQHLGMFMRKKTPCLSCPIIFWQLFCLNPFASSASFFDSPDYETLKKQAHQFIICALHTVFLLQDTPYGWVGIISLLPYTYMLLDDMN